MLVSENQAQDKENVLERVKTSKDLHIVKKIVMAVVGVVGLQVISLLVVAILPLMFPAIKEMEKAQVSGIINFVTYGVLFLTLLGIVISDLKKIKNDFKGWKPYVFGIVFGVAVITTPIIYSLIINLFYKTSTSGNEGALRSFITIYPAPSLLILGLVGPMCEELTYRVGIFSIFKKRKWIGYVISTLIFGFMHFTFDATGDALINEFINLPIYCFSGFAFCLAYDKFGLGCSYTAHAINNLYSVSMVLLLSLMQIS